MIDDALLIVTPSRPVVGPIPDDTAGVLCFGAINPDDLHFVRWLLTTNLRVVVMKSDEVDPDSLGCLLHRARLDGRRLLVAAVNSEREHAFWVKYLEGRSGVH